MLSFAWKDWERKASNFPPEVAFQLYSFHWEEVNMVTYIASNSLYVQLYGLLKTVIKGGKTLYKKAM